MNLEECIKLCFIHSFQRVDFIDTLSTLNQIQCAVSVLITKCTKLDAGTNKEKSS